MPKALSVVTTRPLMELFAEEPWWNKLNADERSKIQTETKELSKAMLDFGHSKLAIGQHLSNLQSILEPQRAFVRYLGQLNFSQRTAYRYISGWKNASAKLPEPILDAAMSRGLNMIGENEDEPLGIYTDAVKKLPPPNTKNPEKINAWLNEVKDAVKVRRVRNRKDVSEDLLLKRAFRVLSTTSRYLPDDYGKRVRWLRRLAGYTMYEMGITRKQMFAPIEPPAGYKAVRGRPRLDRVV